MYTDLGRPGMHLRLRVTEQSSLNYMMFLSECGAFEAFCVA